MILDIGTDTAARADRPPSADRTGGAGRIESRRKGAGMYSYTTMPGPVGTLKLVASDRGLAAVLWENDRPGRVRLGELREQPDHAVLRQTERQLREYFEGRRTRFSVALDSPGTDFQKSVWARLLAIPFGATRTYGQIARQLGRTGAARAVGAAIGANPWSIITPCHRVIGANGTLTGFAGGLRTKAYLLALELRSEAPALDAAGRGVAASVDRPMAGLGARLI